MLDKLKLELVPAAGDKLVLKLSPPPPPLADKQASLAGNTTVNAAGGEAAGIPSEGKPASLEDVIGNGNDVPSESAPTAPVGITSLSPSLLGAEACGIKSAAAEESSATEAPGHAAAGSWRRAVGRESARREGHAAAGAAAACSAATGRRQTRRPGRSRRPRRQCCPRRASSWTLRRRRRRPRRARGATQRWGASRSCWPSLPMRAASPSPRAAARRGRVAALRPTPLAVSTPQPLRRPRLPRRCACPQTSAHRRRPGRPPRSATPPTRRPQRCTALRRMVRRRAPDRCTPRRWRSSRCLGRP
mmetsp:Transcript_9023/g.26313  ORF Transcript_9023/g.26313 Transcript_9023/m.26313 type:complete len:303 (+) Transcript_9023:31-939(+)